MNRLLIVLLTLVFVCQLAAQEEHDCLEPYFYRITMTPYLFSVQFDMESDWYAFGHIVRKSDNFRRHYSLYDQAGTLQASGYQHFFSLGALYETSLSIDLYTPENELLGLIRGQKSQPPYVAQFSLSNADGICALARLDASRTNILLVDPERENYSIALLVRDTQSKGKRDGWEAYVYDPMAIDPRLLKLFSAVIADRYR